MTLANFAGNLLTPTDPNYDETRFGWNGMIDRKPGLIAKCTSVSDVVAAVEHAAKTSMKVAARCGGHSVSGASMPDGGLVVDLVGLSAVDVDPTTRIARVGGGALLGDLDAATQKHGLAVTAGVEPETGVGGLTLGGGIGFLSRKLGLTIDNLLGAEIVLADGSVVYAEDQSHPDLFWAIRGGGGQFGIVTRFDFQLHPIGPQIVVAQAYYPLNKAHEVMRFVRDFMHGASENVTLVPAFMKIPPVDPFPKDCHGEPCVAIVAAHFADRTAADQELLPLMELGEMIFGFIDDMPYVEFQKTFAGASPKGGRYYWKSVFLDDLNDEVTDVLVHGIRTLPGEYTMIFMETLGGAVGRVAVEETAFPNRSARYNLGLSAGWVEKDQDDAIIAVSREWFKGLERYSDGTVYLNYLDRDEAERTKIGFGPHYDRLREIKSRYDPTDLFVGSLATK
jgi:hypothetical protein